MYVQWLSRETRNSHIFCFSHEQVDDDTFWLWVTSRRQSAEDINNGNDVTLKQNQQTTRQKSRLCTFRRRVFDRFAAVSKKIAPHVNCESNQSN